MTFAELLEVSDRTPVRCADGRYGLLIRWFEDTASAGVQVPGEEDIREIPVHKLTAVGDGALVEEPQP